MAATATLIGKMNWDDSAFKRGIAGTESGAKRLGANIKRIFVASAIAGVVKKAFSAAGEFERFETQFTTLLGSVDKSKERMEELVKFAATTPFELPGIATASKLLEQMTHGTLSTGDGLRMVGDAAALAGEPIEEIAVHAGRMWAGLMGGRKVGESLNRLQELGILSVEARNKIEDLQKQGQKGESVWAIAAADLASFGGQMDKQAKTWEGRMSTLKDATKTMFRWLMDGGGLENGKSLIVSMTGMVETMGPAVKVIGTAFSMLADGIGVIFDGNTWKGIGLEMLATAHQIVAVILKGLEPLINAIGVVTGVGGQVGTDAVNEHVGKAEEASHHAMLFRQKRVADEVQKQKDAEDERLRQEKAAREASLPPPRSLRRIKRGVGSGFSTPSALDAFGSGSMSQSSYRGLDARTALSEQKLVDVTAKEALEELKKVNENLKNNQAPGPRSR